MEPDEFNCISPLLVTVLPASLSVRLFCMSTVPLFTNTPAMVLLLPVTSTVAKVALVRVVLLVRTTLSFISSVELLLTFTAPPSTVALLRKSLELPFASIVPPVLV